MSPSAFDILSRFAGLVLLFFGIWFIPRNVRRYFVTRPGGRWSKRRLFNAGCWVIITLGYLIAGVALVLRGWSAHWAGIAFACSMLGFIPVPCHWSIFNTSRAMRLLRDIFFVLLAGGAIWLSTT